MPQEKLWMSSFFRRFWAALSKTSTTAEHPTPAGPTCTLFDRKKSKWVRFGDQAALIISKEIVNFHEKDKEKTVSISLTETNTVFLLKRHINLWTKTIVWDFGYEDASFRKYNFHQAVSQKLGIYAIGVPVVNKIMQLHVKWSPSQQCGGATYLVSGLSYLRVVWTMAEFIIVFKEIYSAMAYNL